MWVEIGVLDLMPAVREGIGVPQQRTEPMLRTASAHAGSSRSILIRSDMPLMVIMCSRLVSDFTISLGWF